MSFGCDVTVSDFCRLSGGCRKGSLAIGDRTIVHEFCILRVFGGYIEIGCDCSLNPFVTIYGHGGVRIGNDVRVAAHTIIVASNHRFERLDVPIAAQGTVGKGIRIENDVWIGANCCILDGVHIGQGAVVGAGSVVTKDIQPYTVVTGVPAKVLKVRTVQPDLPE